MLINECPSPEAVAIRRKHQDVAARILAAMSARDREVMMRFYLDGHAAKRIEADLGLTETQFRLIKSRAKASFTACAARPLGP